MPSAGSAARHSPYRCGKFLYGGNWYESSELSHLVARQPHRVRAFIDVGASLPGPYTFCADGVPCRGPISTPSRPTRRLFAG